MQTLNLSSSGMTSPDNTEYRTKGIFKLHWGVSQREEGEQQSGGVGDSAEEGSEGAWAKNAHPLVTH